MGMLWIQELVAWWSALPRDMALLFALPFAVAAAGLAVQVLRPPVKG